VLKTRRGRIVSVGTYVPENIMTNADFEKILDTSDEWITTRTGIRERHITPKASDINTTEMGLAAARIALDRAGITADQIDGIICATITPDFFYPSTACRIQGALGCRRVMAFDCAAACAGFIYGLTLANNCIAAGQGKTYLIVGSETMSRSINWTDRSTAILFGDGAGAVVLQATDEPDRGVLSTILESDGTLADILSFPAWAEKRTLTMKGNEVFKHAVRMMSDLLIRAIATAGLTLDHIDYIVPHQANIRIIKAIGENLKLPKEKVFVNLDRYGNTSSASIPLALGDLWAAGELKKDTTLAFTALGGGLALGSAVVRF
jgi:3-oxoacyl-[acyl-carrier-protein] synthase III